MQEEAHSRVWGGGRQVGEKYGDSLEKVHPGAQKRLMEDDRSGRIS